MATFDSLPAEILAYILKLSTESQDAREQQHARFAFSLIARACFLTTAGTTEFHVAGEKQAKAFISKLERDAIWIRKEGSGDTPFIPRISNVRRLSLILDNYKCCDIFVTLLRATPNLIALNLDAVSVTMSLANASAGCLAQMKPALGRLARLRELQFRAGYMDRALLDPHPTQRALSLRSRISGILGFFYLDGNRGKFSEQVTLPHLHTLSFAPANAQKVALICALANSTAGIKVLDFEYLKLRSLSFASVDLLVPIVAGLVDFTWTPEGGFLAESNLTKGARDAILKLLGAMQSLEYIHITLWSCVQQLVPTVYNHQPIDPRLFDTLATLPSLSTVKLLVNSGKLGEEHVISYLKSRDALRFLSTRFETDGRWTLSWTPEQRRRVEDASEEAGIHFAYSEIHA